MRIPFPERIAYPHAVAFAAALGIAQLIQGSNPVIVAFEACFILITVAAFNIAGGFYYCSGAYIGINAILTLLLPMVAKVFLGESAQRNLHQPVRTVEVYVCGAIAMLVGAIFTSRFRRRKAMLSDVLSPADLQTAYYGSIAMAILFGFVIFFASQVGLGSLANQLNRFPFLVTLLGVISIIYRSSGRKSITWPLLLLMLNGASSGLYTFSKEAFLGPFFCWIIAAAYMRYKLSWLNIIVLSLGLYVTVTYMVPYAQVGRDLSGGDYPGADVQHYMLTHLDEVRATYHEKTEGGEKYHDFDHPVPLLDRLDVLPPDDALVELTMQGHFFGYTPVIASFANYVPHFLWPTKPAVYFGNVYGREIGVLGSEDNATGVSFSFAADAYHEGGAIALLLICPLLFCFVFVVLDSVIGDTRHNPVGLVMYVFIEHLAGEGSVTGLISLVQQQLVAIVFLAYMAKYVLPTIGRFLSLKGKAPGAGSIVTVPSLAAPAVATAGGNLLSDGVRGK